jgi:hypothetical protein
MGQAFFVRVSAVGASSSVSFSNAAHLTTYNDLTCSRATADTRPLLQLQLQRAGQSSAGQDDFYVYEQAGATAGFDSGFDALKVQLNGGTQPSIYQQAGGDARAIQRLPAGNVARALGVNAPVAGIYEFVPAQLLNFATGETAWLEDKRSGTWHNLSLSGYQAQLGQGLSTTRFVLHLHAARPLASAPAAVWAGEVQLYPNPAASAPVAVVVSGVVGTTAELTLVNGVGQRVWQQATAMTGRELRTAVPVAGLARGIYTLQVRSGAGVLTSKLVLQ